MKIEFRTLFSPYLCYTCATLARGARATSAHRGNVLAVRETTHEHDPSAPFTTKRGFDLALCFVLLPLVSCLIFIIALAVWIESGRPVFFVQTRVGRDRRRFRLYKFRTLYQNIDDSAARLTLRAFVQGDLVLLAESPSRRLRKPIPADHVTRVGRFLRDSGLDELPQFLNIVRGEMSWVGPRPHVQEEVEVYHEWHGARFGALPGITGLAQVRGARLKTFDDMVLSDLEYIRGAGLLLDLKILFWTVQWAMVGRDASEDQ